jgi:hypothetical protein
LIDLSEIQWSFAPKKYVEFLIGVGIKKPAEKAILGRWNGRHVPRHKFLKGVRKLTASSVVFIASGDDSRGVGL